MEFKGVYTAIITPFKENGIKSEVDWESYGNLLELQKKAGVSGIVPCGTTGESPTLDPQEHDKVIAKAIEIFGGDRVIAGTGSNATHEAVSMSKHAMDAGAKATLQVCPYYNKPNQEGLFRHFGAVAEKVDIDHIVYNIPGRTGREIAPETIARLKDEYSNIKGVKEATGSDATCRKTRELCGKDFVILSGDDNRTCWMMKETGAKGVISVASNIIPGRMARFIGYGLEGDFPAMEKENNSLEELFKTMFIDTNPIPAKHFAFEMRLAKNLGFRLPMCETSHANLEKIRDCIRKYSL